jgi:hypothetical protein
MTLRIHVGRDGPRLAVRLVGRMQRENLADVEDQIAHGGSSVVLDLDEVTLVDLEVVRFLKDAEAAGVELIHCPPFVRAWIDREREVDG